MKTTRRTITKLLSFCLAAVLFLAACPVTTMAATKTVKNQKFTTNYSTVNKKALTVKKGTVTLKGKQGFLKFKAPKTATYSFTFSDLKSVNVNPANDTNNGFITGYSQDRTGKYVFSVNNKFFKTTGGKSDTLWLGTKLTASYQGGKKTTGTPIAVRKGTAKLKKGQILYLYFYFGKKSTVKLNIK